MLSPKFNDPQTMKDMVTLPLLMNVFIALQDLLLKKVLTFN